MPGLIDQINAHADGNLSLGDLGAVAGKLGQVIETFRTLPDQPAEAIQSLLQEVGDLPVPELRVASQIGSNLARIAESLPTDFSSFTTAFDPILENLEHTVGGDVVPTIRNFIDLIHAIDSLSRFNLRDASQAAPAGAGAGAGTGAAGGSGSAPGGPAPAGSGGTGGAGAAGGAGPLTPGGAGGSPPSGSGSVTPGGGAGGGAGSAAAAPAPDPATAEARAGRLAALASAREGLSVFPSPLNAPALALFLEDILTRMPRENAYVRKIPFYDESQQLLQTTKQLRGLNEAGLIAHMQGALESLSAVLAGTFAGFLERYGNDLQAAAGTAKLADLRTDLAALQEKLASAAAGVEAGNLTGKAADLAEAQAALARILPALAFLHAEGTQALIRNLGLRTRRLPMELERQMRQLLALAEPSNAFTFLSHLSEPLQAFLAKDPAKQLAADFRSVLALPLHLLDLIESSGLQQALEAPTQAINTVLEQMDAVTGRLAAGTSGVFGAVDTILGEIDPEAWLARLRQAIAEFRLAVEQKVKELFEPIVTAIQTALTALKTATDAFDPEAIVAAVKKFLEDLAAIFEKPEVQDALNALQGGIGQATQAIQGIHIASVTDAVEEGIQKVIDVLGMIDPALLPDEVKSTLAQAVSKLPADLDGPITEITEKFDEIVDAGPKKLLKFLSDKAKEVKEALEKFKPSELVGDSLSTPFKDIIAALEAFHPASLFDPVRQALDGFRDDLLARLDPTPLLAPLQPQFDRLKQGLDSVDPEALLRPVQTAISEGAQRLREALPLDELITALGTVLDKLDYGFKTASEFRQSLEKVLEILSALGNSEQQLRDWLQPLLAKVAGLSDVSALQPAVAAIAAAIEGSKAAALDAKFAAARAKLQAPLDLLRPAETLEACMTLRRRFRPDKVAALPASAEKTALLSLLAGFEPLQPAFSEPLASLGSLRTAFTETAAEWTRTLSRWDARHHRAGGPLARMANPSATAAQLRDMLSQTLEAEFIVPVGRLFSLIDGAAKLIREPLQAIIDFLKSVETRTAALLTGPGTLGGLVTGLQGLADRISGFDIGFLTRELGALFAAVKAKIAALDPSHISGALRGDLELALGILSVDTLLPPTLLPELDALCQSVAGKLKLLDPKVIVEKTLEPVWNERVKPQVEKLDFSPLLDALLAKLEDLKTELGTELGDVNDKYQALLAAIPAGSGSPSAAVAVGA